MPRAPIAEHENISLITYSSSSFGVSVIIMRTTHAVHVCSEVKDYSSSMLHLLQCMSCTHRVPELASRPYTLSIVDVESKDTDAPRPWSMAGAAAGPHLTIEVRLTNMMQTTTRQPVKAALQHTTCLHD